MMTSQFEYIPADSYFIRGRNVFPLGIGAEFSLKCSVIIPCYNYGRFLSEAIESVLTQSLKDIEIIIVDDGSTDPSTRQLIDEWDGRSGVRSTRQYNQGLPAARNTGIELAKGRYICCLDADDVLENTYLEQCILLLENYENVGFAYSWVQLFGNEDSLWKTRNFDLEVAIQDNWTSVAAVFRKIDWRLAGGYDVRMRGGYEDWEFWLRLAQLGRAGKVIERPLFRHRKHGVSMTQTAKEIHYDLVHRMASFNPDLFTDIAWRNELSRLLVPKPKNIAW